jgi:transposase
MIAAWCKGHLLAPMSFKGYCDSALVETWVEQLLVPALQPGQVVVLDNASFHKSAALEEMIEQAGCKLLFLPPYSPDLNNIEKFWARLKHWLRRTSHQFEEFWDAVDHAFKLCLN